MPAVCAAVGTICRRYSGRVVGPAAAEIDLRHVLMDFDSLAEVKSGLGTAASS